MVKIDPDIDIKQVNPDLWKSYQPAFEWWQHPNYPAVRVFVQKREHNYIDE